MIKLEVEDYCHQCLDFNPDVTVATRIVSFEEETVLGDTVVRCKYRKRCTSLTRYLERQLHAQYKMKTTKEDSNGN